MITAVDTSALLAILKGEPAGEAWIHFLAREAAQGPLVVCDIVLAELAPAFASAQEVMKAMADLSIDYLPTAPESAYLAGEVFRQYRRQGGPREHLIPDFLIGAHAHRQANQLAATDRGYLRRHFPRLKLIVPAAVS